MKNIFLLSLLCGLSFAVQAAPVDKQTQEKEVLKFNDYDGADVTIEKTDGSLTKIGLKYKFRQKDIFLYPDEEYAECQEVLKQVAEADVPQINQFIAKTKDLNRRYCGEVLLSYALAENPDIEVSRQLIENGADVNALNELGVMPLNAGTMKVNRIFGAVYFFGSGHQTEKQKQRIKRNVNHAVAKNNAIVKLLLEKGADINQLSRTGTPLMFAASNPLNLEVVKLLLAAGADVNKIDENGETALFKALDDKTIETLIAAGADVNIKNKNNQTYLQSRNQEPKKSMNESYLKMIKNLGFAA